VTLPLPLRNHLAELIVESLHDPVARSRLGALVRFCHGRPAAAEPTQFPSELFEEQDGGVALKVAYHRFQEELCARTARAWDVLHDRPLAAHEPPPGEALDQAADLFDARLYFEVHELLEPYWFKAEGAAREALQGLIQVAVAFHHLANGNVKGARMLLAEGMDRISGRPFEGRELTAFAASLGGALDAIPPSGTDADRAFDWSRVPPFPRAA
jgi:hypothetical protein